MALVASTMALPASFSSVSSERLLQSSNCSRAYVRSMRFAVRASNDGKDGIGGVIDNVTKKKITTENVLKNQEQNESEKKSVFGAVPKSGSVYPRPEIDRRPETGNRSFSSIMAFDGAGPETINGRLAMLGIVWAFAVERMTGQTVAEQLFSEGSTGLFSFFAVAQLFWFASLIPMFKGESPDSRAFGPFRAMAERWNGRTAMLGFLALVITEAFTKSPVFGMFGM